MVSGNRNETRRDRRRSFGSRSSNRTGCRIRRTRSCRGRRQSKTAVADSGRRPPEPGRRWAEPPPEVRPAGKDIQVHTRANYRRRLPARRASWWRFPRGSRAEKKIRSAEDRCDEEADRAVRFPKLCPGPQDTDNTRISFTCVKPAALCAALGSTGMDTGSV